VERLSLDQQEAVVASLIQESGMRMGGMKRNARQTCTKSTGFAGSRRPGFVMRYTSPDIGRLPAELTARMATGKYSEAEVGACVTAKQGPFTSYSLAVMLYQ
jgi:hypothetical protein